MTAKTRGYIVCNCCGRLKATKRAEPPAKWRCARCGVTAAWWFPADERDHAETHAATIADRYQQAPA